MTNALLIRRRGLMAQQGSLPYDAKIEYLRSNGSQYILLNIYGDGRAIIDALGIISSSTSQILFATTQSGVAGSFLGKPGSSSYWGFGLTAGTLSSVPFEDRALADITFDGNGILGYVNNSYISRITSVTQANWALFAGSSGQYPFDGYVYSFKGYKNGVLVRDMIPVRVGTVGYMYDRVSGQLFGNDGTGDFILGPDVQ